MDWRNREPVFTQKEVIEIQKGFNTILEIIHRRTYNMFHKYKNNKDLTEDFIKQLDFIFDEMRVIEKDIKISESDAGNTNSL